MLHGVLVADTSQHQLFGGNCVIQDFIVKLLQGNHDWGRPIRGGETQGLDIRGFAGDTVGDLFRIQGTLNRYGCHNILQWHAIPSGLNLVGPSLVFQQIIPESRETFTHELYIFSSFIHLFPLHFTGFGVFHVVYSHQTNCQLLFAWKMPACFFFSFFLKCLLVFIILVSSC